MTTPRRALPALAAACGALLAAGTAAVVVADPDPAPAPAPAPVAVAAGEGLCVDLSPLNLPSLCVGSLL